jgi:hypothetical protein
MRFLRFSMHSTASSRIFRKLWLLYTSTMGPCVHYACIHTSTATPAVHSHTFMHTYSHSEQSLTLEHTHTDMQIPPCNTDAEGRNLCLNVCVASNCVAFAQGIQWGKY